MAWHGHFTIKHGRSPIKHGRFPIKNGRFPPGAALAYYSWREATRPADERGANLPPDQV